MTLKTTEGEILANHSTFKIGGPAKFFIEATTPEELKEVIEFAKNKSLPFFVLGGGSNVLFSDDGYDGVIIKLKNSGIEIQEDGIVKVGAGTILGQLISKMAEAGLAGLEWGAGIPGTVGGGVNGNCGAYGNAISNNVKSVTVLDENGDMKKYSKDECDFEYRSSRFKKKDNNEIILEVELELAKEDPETLKNKIKEIVLTRAKVIPPYPSAGSVFKNLFMSDLNNETLAMIPPDKIKGGRGMVPMGYLIEACNLKGRKIGGAMVPELHAGFIVNAGGATAKDVLALMELCKNEVKNKFGIDLEVEKIVL